MRDTVTLARDMGSRLPDVPPGTEVEIVLFALAEQQLSELKGRALQGRGS
jgi:hypothetical protein